MAEWLPWQLAHPSLAAAAWQVHQWFQGNSTFGQATKAGQAVVWLHVTDRELLLLAAKPQRAARLVVRAESAEAAAAPKAAPKKEVGPKRGSKVGRRKRLLPSTEQ